jgi:outer membrane protein assembly factor BamB
VNPAVNALSFLCFLAAAPAPVSTPADVWPQWRGVENDGVSRATKVPTKWSNTENVVWKLALPGMGSSTPVLWRDRLFLTSQDGEDLVLMCVSTDGKELWKKVMGRGSRKARGDEGNEASASPSTDGKHVWAFVGTGNLGCFDLDGKEVWMFDVQQRYGKFRIQFGMHSTPVLYQGRIYLQLLHDGGQLAIALDAADGKEVWKVDRKSDGRAECLHSYASAMMWHKGNDAALIVHGNDYSTAHSLKDGAEVWRVGNLNPKAGYNPTLRFVATPLVTPDLIVIPTAKGKSVVAVKPKADGEEELWRTPGGTPDVPSPLLFDRLVYLCGENGSLTCLDAETGKKYYSERIHNTRHRGSPVYADGKVICVGRDGVITVAKAGQEFKVLAENRMNEDVTASPVVVDGRVYIRGWKNLYAIGEK